MREQELHNYLKQAFPQENEKCEWKEFKYLKHSVSGKEGDDIISYTSAIANMNGGNLIVGVEDGSLKIVGIQDFHSYTIHSIKLKILTDCPNLSSEGFLVNEFTTNDTGKVVWVFTIPKHTYRLPVYAHKKLWQRIDDSLVKMTRARLDAILGQVTIQQDWTAAIIEGATINDLDEIAIVKARTEYIKRNPKYKEEEAIWDNNKFLDKAKLTIRGKVTRTALILLGKDEAEHFLGSSVKIRWNLKTIDNKDKDFEIFSIPLILAVDEVYQKIRNLKYRYLKEGTLFPDEVLRYDAFSIREPLHNAIAHQDYTKSARINIVEIEDDHLIFSNYGTFLPKSIERVVLNDTPEEIYRNPFLVEAMKNLGMIETQGGGIRKIFTLQKQRFFPLPEYDFEDGKVKVAITGKVLNEDFARILIRNPKLKLEDIILLDKIQKKKRINDEEYKYLKKAQLIEGKKAAPFLSLSVIKPINNDELNAEYITNKSFNDAHFKEMILDYLKKFGKAKRSAIDNLIAPKLSPILTNAQKKSKVTNYLSALRIQGKIVAKTGYFWELIS